MTTSKRRAPEPRPPLTRWLLPLVGAAVVLAAAIAAIVLTQGPGGGGSSVRPSQGAASAAGPSTGPWPAAVVEGTALPRFTGSGSDPAVGMAAPIVHGASFRGTPVAITADGRPKVILFLAHWCPHCQREVPLIQAWLNGGGGPSDVDLVSVVTSISPTAPNYPPDAWLAREGWTVPAIADPTGAVSDAYGLPAFPYWVLVDKAGKVQQRLVGEMTITDLQALIGQLRGS